MMKIINSTDIKKVNKSEDSILRQKAEELKSKKATKISSQLSEVEAVLIHELEVHQIELEMQNDELIMANERAKIAIEKYTDLYDFAPSGYFTLSKAGEIIELNLAGANMLGKDRSHLIKSRFGFFVSEDTKPTFNHFLEKVFSGKSKKSCEVEISNTAKTPLLVYITGIATENSDNCLLNVMDITEHKKAEEERERLLKILETSLNEIYVFNTVSLAFEYVNKGALRNLGYTLETMLGMTPIDIKPEFTEISYRQTIAPLLNHQQEQIVFDSVHRRFDGSLYPVEVHIQLVEQEDLKVFLAVILDITERKSTEIALRNSELQLKTLVQTILDLIWLKDKEGVYLSCNTMFERFFGAKEAEIAGKTDYDFVDKKLADFFREHDSKAMAAGKPTSNEEWITFADDGHCAYLETIKTPMYDSNGILLGVPGIGRDITERKQAEEALRVNEKKYRAIFENVQDVFYQIDKDGIIIEMSPSVTRLAGYIREDLIGTPIASFYYDPLEREILLKKIAKDGEIWDYELRLNTKSGAVKLASLNAHIMLDDENRQIGIEGSLRDISERKRMEIDLIEAKEKAEESDRLKTAFLANMSHEIRTPLNGIIGFSEMLNDDDISKEELKEFTSIIQISGRRLIEIVNNVLDVSQIQTGQVKIDISPIQLHSISSDLLAFFSPLAKSKNITLSYNNQLDNNEIIIYSDETKLNQVLINLINNAIKFTISGFIDFGYTIQDDMIQFYVKDTGIGIPEKIHELIFERFAQAEDSFTRTYEGAGLGLAICKGLVELLGGKMWLESEEGKGSTFYFTLPYKTEPLILI